MKDTISCAMIVRDEALNLAQCLDSLKGQVDEIVVVDTGSIDGTLDIARKYTDKVYSYTWNDDFSAARNFAAEKASGQWILSIDADEVLVPGTGDLRRLIAGDERIEAYLLPLHYPVSSTSEYNRFLVLRFFKNNGRYRFQGKIHEQIAMPEKGSAGLASGPVIRHKALPAGERNHKRGRNLVLLKKACSDDPGNPFLQYYIGVEWLGLGKPDRALPCFQAACQNLTDENLLFRIPALRYLIQTLQALGKLDEAICLCLETSLRYPEFTDIYYLGGLLFEEKEEYHLALKWFNQAVECGTPPSLFTHLNGTGSFLAYYHLGYCHQMLGRLDEAKTCYEQALDENPDYFYPVHSLFLVMLAMKGPRQVLQHFKEKGYLNRIETALAVANLFFAAGHSGLAGRCLEVYQNANNPVKEDLQFYMGKYNICSGRLLEGLKCLQRVSVRSSLHLQSMIYRAVTLLLLGRTAKARALSLSLWKKEAARPHALILLRLISLLNKGAPAKCPENVRGVDMAGTALEIFDLLSRCLPEGKEQKNDRFLSLVCGLKSIIKDSSPRGFLRLLEYYQEKAGGTRTYFCLKFNPGGNI